VCQLLLQLRYSIGLQYLIFIFIARQVIFIIAGITLLWRSNKFQTRYLSLLERTHHSPTRTSNCLYVHQYLDFVRPRLGQISNHFTIVSSIFNVNGVSLAGRKW
jgi:hypothetical protein